MGKPHFPLERNYSLSLSANDLLQKTGKATVAIEPLFPNDHGCFRQCGQLHKAKLQSLMVLRSQ
jgi:hypothetical protein